MTSASAALSAPCSPARANATLETGKAATAVSMLASHSPDLMLLDLGLPDRDGQELLN